MKKAKMRSVIYVFLIILAAAFALQTGASAFGDWETVCTSDDIASPGFFADDFDVGSDGTVYCVDSVLRAVAAFSGGSAAVLLSEPARDYARLCLSQDGRTLYLLDLNAVSAAQYTLETGELAAINLVSAGIPAGAPLDIAAAPDGSLYFPDYSENCIIILRPDGSFERLSDANGAGELTAPFSIDINSYGKISVGLAERNQVVFTRSYDDQFMASDTTSAEGGAVEFLCWVAIDDYNNVYQLDGGTNRVVVLNAESGAYETLYPTCTAVEYAQSMCANGNYLYVCVGTTDFSSFRIVRCAIVDEAEAAPRTTPEPTAAPQEDGVPAMSETAPEPETTAGAETAVGTKYISNASDAVAFSGDMMPSDSGMTGFILMAFIYTALLILWIVLIFALRRRKKHRLFIVLAIIWLIVGAAFVLIGLFLTKDTDYPLYVEDAAYGTTDFEPYKLSDDQRAARDEYGSPDSFVILYVNSLRQETWFYYNEALIIDYLGGVELQRGYDADLADYGVGGTPYAPVDFVAGMTPGDALDAADLDRFMIEPLDEEWVEGGVLYYGDGIILGFAEDELCYVETILSEE